MAGVVVLLSAALLSAGASGGSDLASQAAEAEVRLVAGQFERAVREADVESICGLVGPKGFPLGDGSLSRAEFREDLSKADGYLWAFFFDEVAWRRHASGEWPMSLAAFFQKASGVRVEISWRPLGPGTSNACVAFVARDIAYRPTICLARHATDGRWYFSRAPYPSA